MNYKNCWLITLPQRLLFYSINHPAFSKNYVNKEVKDLVSMKKVIFSFPKIKNLCYKGVPIDLKDIIFFLKKNKKCELKFMPTDRHLADKEYNYFIGNSHFMILPYLQNYHYSCSGAFIDCIMNETPVICIKSPMSNYYFQKFGSLWYNCDSVSEMLEIIKKLSNNFNYDYYVEQIRNIRILKSKLSDIKIIAEELKEIIT